MTAEQIKKVEEFREYLKKGSIVNPNVIVDLYNEVFGPDPHTGRLQHYTSCGCCLRRLVKLLIQKAVEAKIDEADETVTEEEKEPQSEENTQTDNDTADKEKTPEVKPKTPKKPSHKKKTAKKKKV